MSTYPERRNAEAVGLIETHDTVRGTMGTFPADVTTGGAR